MFGNKARKIKFLEECITRLKSDVSGLCATRYNLNNDLCERDDRIEQLTIDKNNCICAIRKVQNEHVEAIKTNATLSKEKGKLITELRQANNALLNFRKKILVVDTLMRTQQCRITGVLQS